MCPGFYYLDICVQDLFKKVQALKLTVQQAHVTGLNALQMALGPKLEEHLNNHHEDYRITVACYHSIDFKFQGHDNWSRPAPKHKQFLLKDVINVAKTLVPVHWSSSYPQPKPARWSMVPSISASIFYTAPPHNLQQTKLQWLNQADIKHIPAGFFRRQLWNTVVMLFIETNFRTPIEIK